MSSKPIFSRRGFVKSMGVALALPMLPQALYAHAPAPIGKAGAAHKVLTCNIRVALPADEAKGFGWGERKKLCLHVIGAQQADIICLQEVLRVQNEDIKRAFPDFFSYGFEGPEMDAHQEGYHGIAKNPIFFSKKRYALVSAGNYWLSDTPHIGGSMSWDTARARHVNWVRLKDRRSGLDFRVVNLHLDHESQHAREMQIRMVMEEIKQYSPGYVQLLAGDFNVGIDNPVYQIIRQEGWTDSYAAVHGEEEAGFTVHSFQGENHPKKDKRKKIDFIFFRGGGTARSAEIIKDHKGDQYPSDHYFVSADLMLETEK
ncbi:endonuclease/exonuclease/phosphatase family protein [Pontibacter mangrovi]|uniref:Endonuclease/exonuclease/phosphatase family protein n=1 Tax=Pontibacter mangrovi TaxID=2589816 RepID=A0A501W566_9BACT|nr:endonuclease/exonuclease/phosphatase family protein [Pontibacter mangrovi]TPE42381.1 endonuclease/exonuclease/phosphatase family protein [Pontibacter mangrovi]